MLGLKTFPLTLISHDCKKYINATYTPAVTQVVTAGVLFKWPERDGNGARVSNLCYCFGPSGNRTKVGPCVCPSLGFRWTRCGEKGHDGSWLKWNRGVPQKRLTEEERVRVETDNNEDVIYISG